jgi:threonine/homoserine/homoserine lactone efflux protein
MLVTPRARINGPLFVVGWLAGLALVGALGLAVAGAAGASDNGAASSGANVLQIALGAVLILFAVRQWRKRPKPGEPEKMPAWMNAVEDLSPVRATAMGFALSAVNPKNLILTAGAAAGLAQLGLSTSDVVVAIAVFVVIGSLTIVGPVLYALFGGEKARTSLDSAKAWLTTHNAAVMAALFLVFGVDLIAKGLPPLTS